MKGELKDDIYHYLNFKSGNTLPAHTIEDIMDFDPKGREKVFKLWEKQHEEDGFPPVKLSRAAYYFMLEDMGIITKMQYDLLMLDL